MFSGDEWLDAGVKCHVTLDFCQSLRTVSLPPSTPMATVWFSVRDGRPLRDLQPEMLIHRHVSKIACDSV